MKAGYLFSITVIPIFLLGTPIMDQKEKGQKENDKGKQEQRDEQGDGKRGEIKYDQQNNKEENQGKGKHGDERYDQQNDQKGNQGKHGDKRYDQQNDQRGNHEEGKYGQYGEKKDKNDWKERGNKGNDKEYDQWGKEDKWTDGKWDDDKFDKRMYKLKDAKRNHWVNERVYNGVSWWDGNNYYQSKGPKGNKKVTICHKPNGSDYPVTINVSVNALQAHLNHGDYQGTCKDYDRSVYHDAYWTNRDTYYNKYYQTTETLSFGEQLLVAAIGVLTNRKAQLVASRPTLTPSQINAREQSIINLQNNVYGLQNSLSNGNQRVATVNVSF